MENPSLWLKNEFGALAEYIQSTVPRKYKEGEIIYQQGDYLDNFFLLEKGVVKISIFSADGSEKILGFQSYLSLFGMDCFSQQGPAVVASTALTDIEVYSIEHNMMKEIIDAHPPLGIILSEYYSKILRLMCFQVENQSFYTALTRVINFLYLYANEKESENNINIYMTELELASLVATSRVHTARVLKNLRDENIITTSRGKIVILDKKRLLDLCSFSFI